MCRFVIVYRILGILFLFKIMYVNCLINFGLFLVKKIIDYFYFIFRKLIGLY